MSFIFQGFKFMLKMMLFVAILFYRKMYTLGIL